MIFQRHQNRSHTNFRFPFYAFLHRWTDIKSIVGHKRLFVIETAQSQRPIQFQFSDAEVAKYVRKMCVLQEKFNKEYMESCSESVRASAASNGGGGGTYTITQPDNLVNIWS